MKYCVIHNVETLEYHEAVGGYARGVITCLDGQDQYFFIDYLSSPPVREGVLAYLEAMVRDRYKTHYRHAGRAARIIGIVGWPNAPGVFHPLSKRCAAKDAMMYAMSPLPSKLKL